MIIAVASGKGGTGKTLVATSLAISLNKERHIKFLDCDVEEPNANIFFKINLQIRHSVYLNIPDIITEKCNLCGVCSKICAYNAIAVLPNYVMPMTQLCHGCGACVYLCPQKAIKEKQREVGVVESGNDRNVTFIQGRLNIGEAMATPVIREVKRNINNNEDLVIIDTPPGTSCPVIESVKGSDFCLLVTEPTSFGLNDLRLAVETIRYLKIPCGVIINRYTFDNNLILDYCKNEGIPILGKIPLDVLIAREYSKGNTLVAAFPQWEPYFISLYNKIEEIVNETSSYIKR